MRLMWFLLAFWFRAVWGLFLNSTQVITDLTTVINNLSTTQLGRATNANGPMMDLIAMLKQCQLKFQEAAEILFYILYGNMAGSQGGTIPEGGSAALLQSGDSNAANTYTLAVGVLNDLQ